MKDIDTDKITLDIDFDNEDENVEEKEEREKIEEKNKRYVKGLITQGLGICNKKAESVTELLDNIELFSECGINDYTIFTLQYLEDVFSNILPSLLIGNYENILLNDKDSDELYENTEEQLELLKTKRVELLKGIAKIKK